MNETNVIKIIAKNIHDIRLEKNISLQELAEKTNTKIEELRKLGSGVSHSNGVALYVEIAKVLGVTFEEITKGIQFVED